MQFNNNNSNTGIHCKVSCNGQFRRFLFVGTEFSSLFKQVQHLLGLDNEFVLKYKDTEGDLITLSSNEELACALSYSEGNVLRLSAVRNIDQPTTIVPAVTTPPVTTLAVTTPPVTTPEEFVPSFHGGRRGGRCGRGRGQWGRGGHCDPEQFRSKIIAKRDYFKSVLAELDQASELSPEQRHLRAKMMKKLERIEFRISKFQEPGFDKKEGKRAKCEEKGEKSKDKLEKKWRKEEKKHHDKKKKVVLSEEVQTQIAILKSQIDALKPGFKEAKTQLLSKKAALKEAKAAGANTQELEKEIADLKVAKNTLKGQIRPIKEKIIELKHCAC